MQLRVSERTEKVGHVLTALQKIKLDERGRAFHGIPSKDGNLLLSEEVLAEEYPGTGVLVVSGTPLRVEGEEGTVFFGIRQFTCPSQTNFNKNMFTMREITFDGLSEMTDAVMTRARGWQKVHLIIDISVVDPVFLGSQKGIPGGFTSREILYVVQRLSNIKHLSSAEIVFSGEGSLAATLTAKIVAELL